MYMYIIKIRKWVFRESTLKSSLFKLYHIVKHRNELCVTVKFIFYVDNDEDDDEYEDSEKSKQSLNTTKIQINFYCLLAITVSISLRLCMMLIFLIYR